MKKLFATAAFAAALLSGPAYAVDLCGPYQPNCVPYPYGLDELVQLDPNHFDAGAYYFSGFSEDEYHSVGMEEYIAYNGEAYDGSYAAPPNALTVQAIKDLKVIVDGKLDAFTPGSAPAAAATNAATNAPTNLTVLSVLSNEANATNTKQNDLAAKYNDLAGKFNTLVGVLASQGIVE